MRGSHSKISTFTSCKRNYYYSYIKKLEPKTTPDYFIIGGIFGGLLQRIYDRSIPGDARAQILKEIEEKASKHFLVASEVAHLDKLKATISGMLGGYYAYYKEEIAKTKLLAKELKIEFPVGKHIVAGRVDMLLDIDDKKVVDEDKTCSNIDQFVEDMEMSLQVPIYLIGLKHMGIQFDEARYNIVKKPTIKLKKTETPEQFCNRCRMIYFEDPVKYFHRQPLNWDQAMVNQALKEIEAVLDDIERLADLGDPIREFYRNRRNCARGSHCAYKLLCIEGMNDETLQFFQKKVWRS